ncbi:hypothetical protein RhiirA1_463865 [Rhizophagus irregularis]|uniref:Uncharacterized protein n=2 Tax=Rhizophagus irregularis TaxID=588596 RepID=A0A2N0RJ88_9GLOM|nr:hypothetical protein RhiirA1_463865 [Rhizophagus irregularis]
MKECLDLGIEKGADLKILRVQNELLYDRSHPKNVYDDPYRLRQYSDVIPLVHPNLISLQVRS